MAYEHDIWLGGPFQTLSHGNRTTRRGMASLGKTPRSFLYYFMEGVSFSCGAKGGEGSSRSFLNNILMERLEEKKEKHYFIISYTLT